MKKKIVSLLIAFVLIVTMIIPYSVFPALTAENTITADPGWYNANETNLTIADAADLLAFAHQLASGTTYVNQTITLADDIDMNPGWISGATIPANVWPNVAGKSFCGIFNGGYHTISGLYYNTSSTAAGFFGMSGASTVDNPVIIKDLAIINSYLTCSGGWNIGAIFGKVKSSTKLCELNNIYLDVQVCCTYTTANQLSNVGGFVGLQEAGSALELTSCVFNGTVNGGSVLRAVAGIIGRIYGSCTLTDSAFYGNVITGYPVMGGLVARIDESAASLTIENCISAGTITSNNTVCRGAILGQIVNGSTVTVLHCLYANETYAYLNLTGSDSTKYQNITNNDLYGTGFTVWLNTNSTYVGFDDWISSYGAFPMPETLVAYSEGVDINTAGWYIDHQDDLSYTLTTASQLLYMAKLISEGTTFENKTINLGNDIDLNPDWTASENAPLNTWAFVSGKSFAGTFDGNSHTISGMYISAEGANSVGMFSQLTSGACIQNLAIVNSYFYGTKNIGSFVGNLPTGGIYTLTNLYSDSIIKAVGSNDNFAFAGGIVGWEGGASTVISNCVFAGDVIGTSTASRALGGILGGSTIQTATSTILLQDCAWYGSISAQTDVSGGLIGRMDHPAIIKNCISAGTIVTIQAKTFSGMVVGQMIGNGNVTNNDVLWMNTSLDKNNESINAFGTATSSMATGNCISVSESELNGVGASVFYTMNTYNFSNWEIYDDSYPYPTTVSIIIGLQSGEVSSKTKGLVGYQLSTAINDVYSIRFVGIIDSLDYDQININIKATTDSAIKNGSYSLSGVYQSINGMGTNDELVSYSANSLGGEYIFAIVLTDIPVDLSITFEIQVSTVIDNVPTLIDEVTFTNSYANAE